MHASLCLLDKAIALSRLEFELLQTDEVEGLEESAVERSVLFEQAWVMKDGCPEVDFRERLTELRKLQRQLSVEASALFETTREELKKHNTTTKVIRGYGKKVGYKKNDPRIVAKMS